jgi:hypothetical protein
VFIEQLWGCGFFLKDLSELLSSQRAAGRSVDVVQAHRKIMSKHAGSFKRHTPEERERYAVRIQPAQSEAHVRNAKLVNECHARLAVIGDRLMVEKNERRANGAPLLLSSCKLAQPSLDAIEAGMHSASFRVVDVEARRAKIVGSPPVPGEAYFASLAEMPIGANSEDHDWPAWVSTIARCRAEFRHCCFRCGLGNDARFYKFMFAMQSPLEVVFCTLTEVELFLRCDVLNIETCDAAFLETSVKFTTSFKMDSFLTAAELVGEPTSQIYVLDGLAYDGGMFLSSRLCFEPLDDVIGRLPPAAARPSRQAAQPPTKEWHDDIKVVKPWLKNTMRVDRSSPVFFDDSHLKDKLLEHSLADLDDDEMDELFSEFLEARADAVHGPPAATDFEVVVMGGAWTIAHLGRACDAWKGKAIALGGDAAKWATKYGFNTAARFNIDLYGDHGAKLLAKTWCSKCQHFWDIWKHQHDDDYTFSVRDWESWQPSAEFLALRLGLLAPRAKIRCDQLLSQRPLSR